MMQRYFHIFWIQGPQGIAKGKSGDWNRIYFISRQMGISRAWKNIKGLSSSSNENYYDSQSRSYVIQWTAGGGNDGGKATIAAYTFGSANYYLHRYVIFQVFEEFLSREVEAICHLSFKHLSIFFSQLLRKCPSFHTLLNIDPKS